MDQLKDTEENIEISEKYQKLLVNILENKENNAKTQENINKILKQANILFDNIHTPSTLKLDARVIMESTEISSFNLERNIRTEDLGQEFFIESIRNKNAFIFAYLEIVKRSQSGVKFHVMLNFETKEEIEFLREIPRRARNTYKIDLKPCQTVLGSKIESKNESLDKINLIRNTIFLIEKIEFYRLVLDQNDFGNTIENIFYVSCAIKQNICTLIFENDALYLIKYSQNHSQISNDLSHLIIEFNLHKYLDLIKKYKDQNLLLP